MPLLILLLNYLSVERVAPYVAALQEILDASMDEMTQAASIGAEEALMGGDPPAGARDRVQRDFQRGPRGIQDRC